MTDTVRCGECGSTHRACEKCGGKLDSGSSALPPPFGSLNSARPLEVCSSCHSELVRIVFAWAGRTIPEQFTAS